MSDSSRTEDSGTEDDAEENMSNETNPLSMKAVRPRLRSADLAGEGRSSNVEQLVRPALLGRKALRKTCMEDNRDRWAEGNRDTDEERPKSEHPGRRERVKQRKMETAESQEDGARGVQGIGSSGGLFFSDIQKNSILEVEELSNDSQRRNVCPRPKGFSFIQTVTSNLNSHPPRPALPSPRFLSRPVTGDSNHHSWNSYRNPDPFWAEVRTGAASGRTQQNNASPTQASAVTQSESEDEDEEEDNAEGDEEEGSGVVEVTGQSLTSQEALPCVHTEERRVMKRERGRIKGLRRRQRRRERWRQRQQQQSRQVKYAVVLFLS